MIHRRFIPSTGCAIGSSISQHITQSCMNLLKFARNMLKIWICVYIFLNGASANEESVFPNITQTLQQSIGPKIIGGLPARLGEFPYQLSLRVKVVHVHFCGASLVSVLGTLVGVTAAHCVEPILSMTLPISIGIPFYAVAGTVRVSGDELQQTRNITKVIVYENYSNTTMLGDIALLFFDKPFRLNLYVGMIPLPPVNISSFGDLMVSGWGRLYTEGPLPNVLQKLRTPLMPVKECKERYSNYVVGVDSNICSLDDGKGACHGDSGGPARSIIGGYLAGIVSWGPPMCGNKNGPVVYTKVSFYVPWIYESVFRYIINRF